MTFLNGGEMIYQLGLHRKENPPIVYLLSSLENDVDAFKAILESSAKENEALRTATPHFFDLDVSKLPAHLASWEEKSRHTFKLLLNAKKVAKEGDENEDESEDEDEKDATEALADLEIEEEVAEAPKIMEIEDDVDFDALDEIQRKKKEGQRLKKIEEIWEAYHKARVSHHKQHDFALDDERQEEELPANHNFLANLSKNIDHVLSETKLTQEQKDLLRNSVVVLQHEPDFEDEDQLHSLTLSTRIYSLVKNGAVDLMSSFLYEAAAHAPEFHAVVAFRHASPAGPAEANSDLFSKYSYNRIPRLVPMLLNLKEGVKLTFIILIIIF